MEEAPKMISTKDLAYLSDMANWNFNAAKMCYHFANEVEDQQLKDMLLRTMKMHENNFDKIITILS